MRILLRAGSSPFEQSRNTGPATLGWGNSGNVLFAHSVYKALYKPQNQIDVDGYNPDFLTADEINEKYDAFVLPLANAFRQGFVDHLERYAGIIRSLRIPAVVVGVGIQAGFDLAELGQGSIDGAVKRFVSAVLNRSATIGVRGEITAAYLRKLGFAAVDVIGCPSLNYDAGSLAVRKRAPTLERDDPIAVNETPNVPPAVRRIARDALRVHPNSVFVAQQEAQARQWRTSLSQEAGCDAGSRVRYFTELSPWLGFLKSRMYSFGTRIHGNIAALMAGVPASVIVHDARTLELCRYHAIPFVCANALPERLTANLLYETADVAAFNASVGQNFARHKAFLERNRIDHAYDVPASAAAFDARVAEVHREEAEP